MRTLKTISLKHIMNFIVKKTEYLDKFTKNLR